MTAGPHPESLTTLVSHLNFNRLEPTVFSPLTGKPVENPLVTRFKDNSAEYHRPGAWDEEEKFMRANGLDPRSGRVSCALLMELRKLNPQQPLSFKTDADNDMFKKLHKAVYDFAGTVGMKNGDATADMRSFVKDALKETGWE